MERESEIVIEMRDVPWLQSRSIYGAVVEVTVGRQFNYISDFDLVIPF